MQDKFLDKLPVSERGEKGKNLLPFESLWELFAGSITSDSSSSVVNVVSFLLKSEN